MDVFRAESLNSETPAVVSAALELATEEERLTTIYNWYGVYLLQERSNCRALEQGQAVYEAGDSLLSMKKKTIFKKP
jgi:hypothetical protein